jgi:uncharacterized Fe-S cluster-containing radical SAM superfamily protein/predicted phosphodiesterase
MDTLIHLDGPVLVFGGPYSNLGAMDEVLAEARRRGIPPDRVVCTGDVVAYGADAKACVDLVRGSGIRVVMGNCEEALAEGAESCGCGFAPGSACDLASALWFSHASRQLGPEDRAWLGTLPRRIDVTVGGLTLAVIHGSLREINRFVFASTPARVKALDLVLAGTDGIVAGHSGLPFSEIVDGRLWHNPGVVGMPANDGTARVWFSVLTPGPVPRSLAVEHASLFYDHEASAARMGRAGLPGGYADALATGLWPSCDVLPAAETKATGVPLAPGRFLWSRDEARSGPVWPSLALPAQLDPAKFLHPHVTAKGEVRASVALSGLRTLWINTGTLCNLACANCYIESTPRNDRLAYISASEVASYLDEIERDRLGVELIGFTGGEPFMNPDMLSMLEDVLSRGLRALVLTNAMRPMARHRAALAKLNERFRDRLTIRVSIDHYTRELHELERGPRSWQPTIDGLVWLHRNGFRFHVAGRLYSGEAESVVRAGYARLFASLGVALDAFDPVELVLFPEMDAHQDVPEITDACWGILGKAPGDVMCASSRMVVKRKGAERPAVLACTLLAYEPQFELGATLAEASRPVALNHPHCAKFCVLGGAACSV